MVCVRRYVAAIMVLLLASQAQASRDVYRRIQNKYLHGKGVVENTMHGEVVPFDMYLLTVPEGQVFIRVLSNLMPEIADNGHTNFEYSTSQGEKLKESTYRFVGKQGPQPSRYLGEHPFEVPGYILKLTGREGTVSSATSPSLRAGVQDLLMQAINSASSQYVEEAIRNGAQVTDDMIARAKLLLQDAQKAVELEEIKAILSR